MNLVTRPRRHFGIAWNGIVVERSVHGTVYAFIMWRGRTIWIKRAL